MEENGKGAMQIDAALVRQLAQLLAEGDLSEIEVEDGERRIRLKRKIEQAPVVAAAPAPAPLPPLAAASVPAAPATPPADHPGAIKSPMVGTAYLSSTPGTAAFVSVGDKVSVGDTLLIIEAMKVMNAIAATTPGIVRQILIQDGQPVEYDQPLVIIE